MWYRGQHARVLGVVLAVCGDLDVAEDATDEAFVRCLVRWERVRQMESPSAWVCRVAINVMRRRVRRRSMESMFVGRSHATVMQETTGPSEVWAAVRSLPQRQRLAVALRYVGDLTEAEVAAAMGISRGAVAASLHSARESLRLRLDSSFDQPSEAPHA